MLELSQRQVFTVLMCHPVQKVGGPESSTGVQALLPKETAYNLQPIYTLRLGIAPMYNFSFQSCLLPGEQPEPVELLPEGGELGAHLRVDLPHLGLVRRTRELADRNLRPARELRRKI